MQNYQKLLDKLTNDKHIGIVSYEIYANNKTKEITIILSNPQDIKIFLQICRDTDGLEFQTLISICGVDYPKREKRFEVVYHLLSLSLNHRIRIKCAIDDKTSVPSVVTIYPCANWYERETWDMYGIHFSDHNDLRRILTEYDFKGHPLRKDFPLTGDLEVRYDEEQSCIVHEKVNLPQEYRDFQFSSKWTGGKNNPLPGDEKVSSDFYKMQKK